MDPRTTRVADVALGTVAYAAAAGEVVVRTGQRVLRPAAPFLARPPLVPERFAPASVLDRLAERGQLARRSLTREAQTLADQLVPYATDAVLDRVDLTQVALTRLDIERIVKAALAEIDLSDIASDTVEHMDLNSVVRENVDLIGLAEYVVDGIDLPEIIRESTGMVASEAVRGVRIQSMEADEAVSRVVDRLLLRRRQRRTDAPGQADSEERLP